MRKLLDPRINGLIKQSTEENHRAIFVIIGDNAKDQVSTLHHLLIKNTHKQSTPILWCYKKQLELSSNTKKRKRQIRKKIKTGQLGQAETDPLDLFISTNKVTFMLYKDAHRALGQTFTICVLQDFEALTPNLLAQTIETVSGKGLVIILLRKMTSLRQLSALSMDCYSRISRRDFKDINNNLVCRFNERFTLSLAKCNSCLVVDDELNILPISSSTKSLPNFSNLKKYKLSEEELECLKEELLNSKPLYYFLNLCKTLDQAKAFLSFVNMSIEKENAIFSVTAARGRGKTFACGLIIAYALVALKLTNIYVTSPFPQNLIPLFDSLKTALIATGYKSHEDFEAVRSIDPKFSKAVVRFNVHKNHRQFVQYISPEDFDIISKSQPQLVFVDEAAAIPIPITEKFLNPQCLTVLSSTTSGYEGTGRALSIKLLAHLRRASTLANSKINQSKSKLIKNNSKSEIIPLKPRPLVETTLEHPIRYSPEDPVENWLSQLLCLDAPAKSLSFPGAAPHPSECSLYLIDRDSLFSGHKAAELFLAQIMSLFVASHYKNSPNDLQLLSDAPAHRIFALVAPSEDLIPRVVCVVQVAFEGNLSDEVVQRGFAERVQAAGDLIPWTLSTQYQERSFASLLGIRIVRIATSPELQSMGYGSRAIELLHDFLIKTKSNDSFDSSNSSKTVISPVSNSNESKLNIKTNANYSGDNLQNEIVKPVEKIPPLLTPLEDMFIGNIDWLGVSFGLTQRLFNFWAKRKFKAVYLRQSFNKLTGEHSCIMLRKLNENNEKIKIEYFQKEFIHRFTSLLSFGFKNFSVSLALSLMQSANDFKTDNFLQKEIIETDLKRLKAYSTNLVDFSTIIDIVPAIARLYFSGNLGENFHLSFVQKAIFIAIGLQHRTIEDLSLELCLSTTQILGLFNKAIRKFVKIEVKH